MTRRSVTHATFVLERAYEAAPVRVFNAFADPVIKSRWFAEDEGWVIESSTSDFRVGGFDRLRFNYRGGPPMTNDTVYLDIVPDERIIFAYEMTHSGARISASLATVELRPQGGGTRLIFTEQGAYLDGHDNVAGREEGTREMLEALGRELDRGA